MDRPDAGLQSFQRNGAASAHADANDVSPCHGIFDGIDLDSEVASLLAMLDDDVSPKTVAGLESDFAAQIKAFRGHWFQRIDFPAMGISSTSDPANAYIDEGGLNTLGGRIPSRQASILRPYPKWIYIKPRLPDLHDKTVLDVGSSNGFFSFRFAELGASRVTGIEVIPRQVEAANWSRNVLCLQQVQFMNTDLLLNASIPMHDVVFCSEVVNHFLFPFYGLARLIGLARETFILDTGTTTDSPHFLRLDTGWHKDDNRLVYHSYMFSDGLLMDYLKLLGVSARRITRYIAPREHYHILYVVDTRGLAEERKHQILPATLESLLSGMQALGA